MLALKDIAMRTPDEAVELFYNSNFTGKLIEDQINSHGGILQKEDFVNYEVNERDALELQSLPVVGADLGGVQRVPWNPPFERTSLT